MRQVVELFFGADGKQCAPSQFVERPEGPSTDAYHAGLARDLTWAGAATKVTLWPDDRGVMRMLIGTTDEVK